MAAVAGGGGGGGGGGGNVATGNCGCSRIFCFWIKYAQLVEAVGVGTNSPSVRFNFCTCCVVSLYLVAPITSRGW